MTRLSLQVLPEQLGVVRLSPKLTIPDWATRGDFCSITRTAVELSVVCAEANIPPDVTYEPGWRCLQVVGPLDFALVGIMADLSAVLAGRGISLFAISTYDTDYLLVKAVSLEGAIAALTVAGHSVKPSSQK